MANGTTNGTGHGTQQVAADLDAVLRALPGEFAVASQAAHRLVVGRPGAFVLCAHAEVAATAVEPLAARIARLATSTRVVLADHLSWVPFIDAVVVTPPGAPGRGPVTMAPLDLVAELLTAGPDTIAAGALDAIRGLLRENRLGVWRAGIGEADGRIDLCDPLPTTTPHPRP